MCKRVYLHDKQQRSADFQRHNYGIPLGYGRGGFRPRTEKRPVGVLLYQDDFESGSGVDCLQRQQGDDKQGFVQVKDKVQRVHCNEVQRLHGVKPVSQHHR